MKQQDEEREPKSNEHHLRWFQGHGGNGGGEEGLEEEAWSNEMRKKLKGN